MAPSTATQLVVVTNLVLAGDCAISDGVPSSSHTTSFHHPHSKATRMRWMVGCAIPSSASACSSALRACVSASAHSRPALQRRRIGLKSKRSAWPRSVSYCVPRPLGLRRPLHNPTCALLSPAGGDAQGRAAACRAGGSGRCSTSSATAAMETTLRPASERGWAGLPSEAPGGPSREAVAAAAARASRQRALRHEGLNCASAVFLRCPRTQIV